ncbi:MAG: hypothetical protein JO129_00780 [Candidatus Dependentiae bacterium]|nr:hypothetical protein [Candidatus Dependentiae bacterium]
MKHISYCILLSVLFCNIYTMHYASSFDGYVNLERNSIKEKYQLTTEESDELDSFLYEFNNDSFINNHLEATALLIKTKLKDDKSNLSFFDKIKDLREALSYNICQQIELWVLCDSKKIDACTWLQDVDILRRNNKAIFDEIEKIYTLDDNRKRKSDCCDEGNKKLKNDAEVLI